MKTYYSLRFTSIITLILALGAINPLHASPYSDAQNQPSWFQDQEPATIPQPGGDGPGGWSPVEPDNSPEPPQPDPEAQEPVNLHLTSSAFANGESIPLKYTCDGSNVSPPLNWSNVPTGTKSQVLIVTDGVKANWVVFNIAKTVKSIPEAVPNTLVTNGFSQGLTDSIPNIVGYSGPCPTVTNDSKTYTFSLMALDIALDIEPDQGVKEADVRKKTYGHVIGLGTLTGTYKRTIAHINLHSSEFNNGEAIPIEYTCNGEGVSPPLNWDGVPEGAKSLVLTVTQSNGTVNGKSLWIVYNLDGTVTNLPRAIPNMPITNGLYQGLSDSQIIGYTPPCPSMAGVTETYAFTLRALNAVPNLDAGAKMADVLAAINNNLIGLGTLTGTYKRTTAVIDLHSSAFENGANIPVKYTCNGANVSPPLSWDDKKVPAGTKSLVLLVTNAANSSAAWVAFDIIPPAAELPEAIPNTALVNLNATSQMFQGTNAKQGTTEPRIGYSGPCPENDENIIYNFTLMALNKIPDNLKLDGTASMTDVLAATQNSILGVGTLTGTYNRATTAMTLTSSAFSNGGNMPVKYTCDGANVSPPLSWSGEPDSTKSLIVLMTGTDKADANENSRWVVFNIGADKNSLSENATGLSQGVNDFGAAGYKGPCPDLINDTRTYSFTVIAVNKTLAVASGADKDTVLGAISGNIVGSGSMTGKYTRQVTTGMTLTSTAFNNNGNIPVVHTCDGANTSPPLSWSGIPETAKSLVLLATNASGAARWVAFNIAKDSPGSLPAAIPNTANANGISQGPHDSGTSSIIGYEGPCPSAIGGSDTYTFSLTAVNSVLTDLSPGTSNMNAVQSAINGHVVGSATLTGTYTRTATAMTVQSNSITNGTIPAKYTCDGTNVSPQLSWTGAPANTKSLVLLVTHLDTATTTTKADWVAFSIMPTTHSLPEAIPNAPITNGISQGLNDWQTIGYSGPCPTAIGASISYTFTVMALSNVPNLTAGTAKITDVTTAINGHVIGSGALTATYTRTTTVMTVTSDNFHNGDPIPVRYTCDGANVSPQLSWSGEPANTKSYLVLTIDANRTVHWVAFNIAATIHSLPEAVPNAPMANGASQGGNDFDVIGYYGPCPDTANKTKTYTFTVIALDKTLDLTPGFLTQGYEAILTNAAGHVVGSGSLAGTYTRVTGSMTLTSNFPNGTTIPPNYTCVGDATGKVTSPPLAWTGVPNLAKSLVLLTADASAASGQRSQWVVYNLSPTATSLAAGIPNVATYNGFLQGNNDFGSIGYAAPCPAIGDPAHNYVFSLMALDTTINQSANATYASIFAATAGHLIDMAQLTGTVVRPASGSNFSLHSVFTDGGDIPQLYTCDGSSLSPPLNWDHIPASTKSLVLTLTGTGAPDASNGGIVNPSACHWAAFNIPATQTQLAQGQVNTFFTGKFYQAQNYQTTAAYPFYGYAAPCPKQGTTGHYLFNLTALNQQLTDLDMASTCDEVIATVSGNSVLATASLAGQYVRKDVQGDQLSLSSSALTNGGTIPTQYTCDGANISLPLNWKNVPTDANDPTKNTQTLAIVMTDGDADTTAGEPVAHWIAYDIPTTQISLPENMPRLPLVYNTYQGINDFELVGYNGPCPNPGDGAHRYLVEIFALNAKLNINSADMNYDVFLEKTRDKIIESATLKGTYERGVTGFNLTSTAFNFGEIIGKEYTCDGSNKSPPLQWTNPPANTQAFAMLMTDFNASVGTNAHWVLYNVPKTVLSLAEGVLVGASPNPPGGTSAQGFNDFDVQGYSGPCPAAGSGVHQYIFELVALSESITGLTNPTYASVKQAMNGKILGTVKLNGTYSRQVDGAFKLTSPAFADGAKLPDKYRSSYAFPIWDIVIADDKKYYVHRYDDVYSGNATINDDLQVVNDLEAKNISPPLQWDNVPNGTKSLMLLVKSSSAPDVIAAPWEGNTHWIMYDIPPTIDRLDENVAQIPFTIGAYNGVNDAPWGVGLDSPQATPQNNISTHSGGYFIYDSSAAAGEAISQNYWEGHFNGYWGPSRPGRYVFSLVALDKMLELDPSNTTYTSYNTNGVTHTGLIQETLGHIIGTAELLTTKITGPVVTTPINMTVEATNPNPTGTTVTFVVTAFDETDGALTGITCKKQDGQNVTFENNEFSGTFPLGNAYITCTVTNSDLKIGTDTFIISIVDTTPPVFTKFPANKIKKPDPGTNGATIDFQSEIEATDIVDGTSGTENTKIKIECTPTWGTTFSVGTTKVTCKATDDSGNYVTQSFTITIDDEAPKVTVPSNIEETAATGDTDKIIIFIVTAKDNVDGDLTPTCTPKSGSKFTIDGSPHIVECTATDMAGNVGTGTFTVTVN